MNMKLAQEYKGYYLDIYCKNGIINGIIQQTQEQVNGATVEDVIQKFKKKVNEVS